MLERLMKKYALSRQGAVDLIKATFSSMLADLILMLPVALLYLLVNDLLKGTVQGKSCVIYGIGIAIVLVAVFFSSKLQYHTTFFNTYKESGVRRIRLAEKIRRLPLSFFGKKDLSELTTTMMGDCATLETAFSHWIPQFAGSILSTCVVAVGLLFYEWRMAIAALWVLPASLIIVGISHKAQNFFSKRKDEAVMDCADSIQECIETVRDLKANNAEEKYGKKLEEKIDAIETRSVQAELGVAVFVMSAQMLLKFGIATTALAGGVLLIRGEISVILFFAYLMVVSRMYEPMGGSLQNLAAIISTKINIDRMNEIEEYPAQEGTEDLQTKGYDICFDHVGFGYDQGKDVLKDVSFTAKQGEITALIGPSGGGKSTAAKLAARFWDIQRGRITLGGTDISTVDPEKLLSAYAIVFQDVTLFNNTVMENIRIGRHGATDAEVMEAAKKAQCDEFIRRLPEGYQTMIGENGSTLSGGERQRISIARALLKNAPVILLDEATASLDAENETQIQEAISGLVKDKTVLIIAHRMRTVEGADKLVVLKDGLVAEQGSPQELKAANGIYAKMSALQQEGQQWTLNAGA